MRIPFRRLLAAAVAFLVLLAAVLERAASEPAPAAPRPELEYLKAVNRAGPVQDPQLLFLLMGQFANANRPREGADFLAARMDEFAPRLSDTQRALYLSATALLRAKAAGDVSLLQRLQWVKRTAAMLDEAKRLSGGDVFVVRWISGVVRVQLPGFFGERAAGEADLRWCLDHADRAPQPGWLREVRHLLAGGAPGPITVVTPYSEDAQTGHSFSARGIAEVVPGRVYALSGFEFTEYCFFVSDDGRELVGIDAGTREDSAQAAYEALRAAYPKLPPLTTVLITHAHWDHVGGHRYFRSLEPRPRFIARANYGEEIAKTASAPRIYAGQFFGERFDSEAVASFRPDSTVDRASEVRIGGTRVSLIPVQGGETHDALLIELPQLGVMFVGDFIMPYLGAPFLEEGDLDGLLAAIDVIAERQPRVLLHGHQPLTAIFNSPAMLSAMKRHLSWLRSQVIDGIRGGAERGTLQQANLIPPGLLEGDPAPQVAYLVMRENVINRLYDQQVGYWQADLQGLDQLTRADHGAALVDYLRLSERQISDAAQRMIADGRHELAANLLDAARTRYSGSAELASVERLAYLKLMEKYADINPFKFIIYTVRSDGVVPLAANLPGATDGRERGKTRSP